MIEFDGLAKTYGDFRAVTDLTFHVSPGEVYALLGPNGAGKTTALRCLATLLAPTAGTARVNGHDVRTAPLEVRRNLAFLAASMGLYQRLTVREMLLYFGRLHGMEKARLAERVDELVELFDLHEFQNRLCGRLSTGQRQRVSIARAILHDPPALILDEPTLGLDLVSGRAIYAMIHLARMRGRAILFSTHQMEEVELLADRVGVISRGELVAEGTVEELLSRTGQANLARAFLSLIDVEEAF
jgi:sodium transport system ATP-binding protein